MDVAALKAFLAVAESGSFSLAAGRLFLTQPAVSKRVAGLEAQLDVRLFDRIGRTVSLTDAGRALLPRARNILVELEDSVREVSNLSGKVHGTLRFGTSHHIGLHRLPPALKQFIQCYPQVHMDIRFMDSEAACLAVEQGELELGLVTLPPEPLPNLATEPVWPDPLALVVSRDHPLALVANPRPGDLSAHPAILPASSTYTRQIAEREFTRLGLKPDIVLSTNYLETIKMLVSVGMGWSLLPASMLDQQIRVLTLDGIALQRQLGIVYHRDRSLSNAAIALIRLLQQQQQ